jgi:ABC-2 type transport system permease protein
MSASRHMGPIRREWCKLLAQKRTYIGAVGLTLIPIIFSLVLYLSGNSGHESGGEVLLDSLMNNAYLNGLYVPLAALSHMNFFLLPLMAAMVGGFMLAGEAEKGTLRTMLLRPVRRGSVVMAKWATSMLYLAVVLAMVLVAGLISGWAFFGIKPMIIPGDVVSIWHGIWLIVLSYFFTLAFLSCMLSLAMLLSSIIDSSLTAAIVPVVVMIVVVILLQLSFFADLQPYWFTTHLNSWFGLLQSPIDTKAISDGLICFAAWSAGAIGLAWLIFRRRDILS